MDRPIKPLSRQPKALSRRMKRMTVMSVSETMVVGQHLPGAFGLDLVLQVGHARVPMGGFYHGTFSGNEVCFWGCLFGASLFGLVAS